MPLPQDVKGECCSRCNRCGGIPAYSKKLTIFLQGLAVAEAHPQVVMAICMKDGKVLLLAPIVAKSTNTMTKLQPHT